MTKHPIRRIAATLTVVAVGALGVGAAPAGATTGVDSAFADTMGACQLPGLVGYTGAGFQFARFSTWVDGQGWIVGNWQYFQRNWNDDQVLTLAPVPQKGRQFAILAEYAYISVGDNGLRMAQEWVPMYGGGYWCTA